MACCLTAPNHYLKQCWLLISKVLWHSPENNFAMNAQAAMLLFLSLKIILIKSLPHIPSANELTCHKRTMCQLPLSLLCGSTDMIMQTHLNVSHQWLTHYFPRIISHSRQQIIVPLCNDWSSFMDHPKLRAKIPKFVQIWIAQEPFFPLNNSVSVTLSVSESHTVCGDYGLTFSYSTSQIAKTLGSTSIRHWSDM